MIYKEAGLEKSSMTDPRTKRVIRVSTTVRLEYEKHYPKIYKPMSNVVLNDIIAQDFAASYQNAVHGFFTKSSNMSTMKREPIEIRIIAVDRPFNVFFSIIREGSIDVINASKVWKRPKKLREPPKNVGES